MNLVPGFRIHIDCPWHVSRWHLTVLEGILDSAYMVGVGHLPTSGLCQWLSPSSYPLALLPSCDLGWCLLYVHDWLRHKLYQTVNECIIILKTIHEPSVRKMQTESKSLLLLMVGFGQGISVLILPVSSYAKPQGYYMVIHLTYKNT